MEKRKLGLLKRFDFPCLCVSAVKRFLKEKCPGRIPGRDPDAREAKLSVSIFWRRGTRAGP
jgi:hypothetical protein